VALFQTVDPAARRLTGRALDRRLVLAMIKRRPAAAGLPPSTCCHTFRATGITTYLSNGGTLEHAQQIAGHALPKTTKLYDRAARQARSRETGMGSARSIHSPAIPGRDLAERQPGGFEILRGDTAGPAAARTAGTALSPAGPERRRHLPGRQAARPQARLVEL